MIDNTKYYLPFHDGIYSFKEKTLYAHAELPNIHFAYKIDKNFPKYDKNDEEEFFIQIMRTHLIMPI